MTSVPKHKTSPLTFRPIAVHVIILLLGITLYGLTISPAYKIRDRFATETVSQFGQLPSAGVQAASLEFKGVVSDYLFFKTMTYMGMKIGERELPSDSEWALIHEMLQKITDLDPKFWDPYLFTETMLVWQAGMFDEAKVLLEKAADERPWDYRPLYYIGFNYSYFKKDSSSAAPYLRKAAEFEDAPKFLKGLAARVSHYAGQTGIGILFLEDILRDTNDPRMANYLEKRLTALKAMFSLEKKVREYRDIKGELPASLDDLISEGLIDKLPEDPYGGKFFLRQDGRVYTTSEMVEKK